MRRAVGCSSRMQSWKSMSRRKPAWKLSNTTSFQTMREGKSPIWPLAARLSLISTLSMMLKALVVHIFCRDPTRHYHRRNSRLDAQQGELDTVVAFAFVRPAQQLDELQPGEFDLPLPEIAL